MEKRIAFQIEDDTKPNIVAFVELLSSIPSSARKKRELGRGVSRKNGCDRLLEKFLSCACDYSGELAKSLFKQREYRRKKK